MTIGLDTSVVVRLLIGEPAAQAERARRRLVDRPRASPAVISDTVVGETYFALRHHYQIPHPEVLKGMRALLSDPLVSVSGAVRRVIEESYDSPEIPGFMDRLIHAGYRADGVEFVTFDRAAARLEGARLLT